MDCKGTKNRDEGLVYVREQKEKDKSGKITKKYGKTCFHVAHENAVRHTLRCQRVETNQSNKENESITH